jgi:hypothetical protein
MAWKGLIFKYHSHQRGHEEFIPGGAVVGIGSSSQ